MSELTALPSPGATRATPPLSRSGAALALDGLTAALLAGVSLTLLAVVEHLADGSQPAGWATFYAAGAVALLSLLGLPLSALVLALALALAPRLRRFQLWARRLSLFFLFWLFTEILWCLAVYFYRPRLPVSEWHLTVYAAGALPMAVLALLGVRLANREALFGSGRAAFVGLGYAALAFLGIFWPP